MNAVNRRIEPMLLARVPRRVVAHPSALRFMLAGVAIVVPFLIAYTAFAYRVFRGKTRTGLYE